ncbi:uncharacterized protein KY384_002678 [Bacidia gigantensis]|uniref:uncharacterized protein n=1 Tax=Bacidia gigantensis TaxID=2732470 RepID=UPI001D048B83|nr:uncharacterized protein KY384_002678 [Bacidia gigantensis]KAG8532800.1 hypothetical protein KY384_002678 [Bacidia gigantensis]
MDFAHSFATLLDEEPSCHRAARLQNLSRLYWNALDSSDVSRPTAKSLDAFVKLLLDPRDFDLIKLVIPELREHGQPMKGNSPKIEILKRVDHRRLAGVEQELRRLGFDDHPLYRDEKEVFAESEMYRVSLLLHGRANLSTEEKEALEVWWNVRPQTSWSQLSNTRLSARVSTQGSAGDAGTATANE